jgi:CubicO group peptidase (beta-lactamase class C family)
MDEIESLTAAEFSKEPIGSLNIAIVSGGKLVWTKSYGYANIEEKTPATADTVYRIGSVTTQFTALMLLQLVAEGKVHLADPVEKYFPEVNKIQSTFSHAPPITLVQLATHTSGIANEPDDVMLYTKGAVKEWEKVLIAALPHTRYVYEPGTQVGYSNIGYAILGAALSRAAQRPYVDYVQERIFRPLGMNHTAFEPDSRILANLARGYEEKAGKADAEVSEREHQGRGYKVPNGAVYTTITDLARFVAFEMGQGPAEVLPPRSLEENFKRLIALTDERPTYLASGYGIGFRFRTYGEAIIYGHAGGVPGYEARADFERTSRSGVIVLRNIGGRSIHLSTTKLSSTVIEKLVKASKTSAR